jgi:hypothetical protein
MASFGTAALFAEVNTGQAFTVPSGTTVLLIGLIDFGDAPTACSYNAVGCTLVGRATTASDGNLSVWRLANPATGSNNIAFSGPSFTRIVAAVPIIDGDAVVDFGVINASSTSPVVTGTFDTGDGGVAMMLSTAQFGDRPVVSYGSGESALATPLDSGIRGFALSGKATTGSSTTMSHTKTSGIFASCAIAVSVSTAASNDTLTITQGATSGTSGAALSPSYVVESSDSGFTGNVTAAIASGSGSLSGTTTVAAVSGDATFSNLIITGTGAHTLDFNAAGHDEVVSSSITIADPPAPPAARAAMGRFRTSGPVR